MLHNLFYSPDFPTTFPSCPAFQHWSVQLQKLLNNDAVSYHNPPVDPLWHKHFSLRFRVGLGIELILASCWHWLVLCTFHNCVGFPKILRDCKRKITILVIFNHDYKMCTYLHTVDWRIGCPDLAAYCLAISLQFLPWLIFLKSIGLSKGTTSCNRALATSPTPAESKQDFKGVTHLTINWLTSEQKLAPWSNFSWIARGSENNKTF